MVYLNMNQAENTVRQMTIQQDLALYQHALSKGKRAKFLAGLRKRKNELLPMEQIIEEKDVQERSYRGVRTVQIDCIQGSEGRAADFDQSFNPLTKHNQERWMAVARARHQGKALPAVELIQIGEVYVVRDGHHRISVAKSLGEEYIDAKVVRWQTKK
jgi:hypothetical protein